MERCEECGYEYDLDAAVRSGADISVAVAELVELMTAAERQTLAQRTRPDVWSPLQYACHVRDVLLAQRERVLLARRLNLPEAVPMGRDERVLHDGYAEQDPVEVAEELTVAVRLLVNTLERLDSADWERRIVYTWPERCERTLQWVAAHTLHEVHHHLLDVRRQLGDRRTG